MPSGKARSSGSRGSARSRDSGAATSGAPLPMIAYGSIYLRPAERDDVPRFVTWFGDERTTRNLATRSPISLAYEEGWFERMLEAHGRDMWHFVICLADGGRPIGTMGLHDLDIVNGSSSLGISIGDPADTGHGHGTDAMRALLAFGFGELRLERIWLDVYAYNERARHVYERVGFVLEGTLRRALFRDGRFHDIDRMSILREEWESTRPKAASRRRGG